MKRERKRQLLRVKVRVRVKRWERGGEAIRCQFGWAKFGMAEQTV